MFNWIKKDKAKVNTFGTHEVEQDNIYAQVRLLMFEERNDEIEPLLREGVKKGFAKCKSLLASLIIKGIIVGNDDCDTLLTDAFEELQRIATQGDVEALTIIYSYFKNDYFSRIAHRVRSIRGCKNYTEAFTGLSIAAGKGYYIAQMLIAQEFINNGAVKEGEYWYEKAAEQYPCIQYLLATLYATGQQLYKDELKSFKLIQMAAENGERRAQYILAGYYVNGTNVEKNLALAKSWANKSVVQHYEPAKELMAQIEKLERLSNLSQPWDALKQIEMFNKAQLPCEENDVQALMDRVNLMNDLIACNFAYSMLFKDKLKTYTYNIALLKELQAESESEKAEVFRWFSRAQELGVKESVYHLAIAYYEGLGVEQDFAKAIKYFRECLDSAVCIGEAWYYLGNCYNYGLFYEKDSQKAREYYLKAIEYGFSCQTALLENEYNTTSRREANSLSSYAEALNSQKIDLSRSAILIEKDLRDKFGELWNKLSQDAQYALVSGIDQYFKIAYWDIREDRCKDYSPVIMETVKALEVTLKQKLFVEYMEYLKKMGVLIEDVPGLEQFIYWDKNKMPHYPIPEKVTKFTLGSVRHVCEIGPAYDFKRQKSPVLGQSSVGAYMLDYFKETSTSLFSNESTKTQEIEKYIKELCDELSIIVKLRNAAAHNKLMNRTDAEVCADCIILVKKILIGLLEKIN